MKRIALFLFAAMLLFCASCNRNPHFITDRAYRSQVMADFDARQPILENLGTDYFAILSHMPRQEAEALKFLYAYMPYSDLADYDLSFFHNQVRYAFMARDSMSWGRLVPEDIFRHFVLVYRVNNENLDTARMYMYHELKARVSGLSMEEAALEVNHWCHEHVAYRAADARTSAPLATMRTSLGRCGEESTFAVTALRAVGIPARQCYTPRWAHCDDNHAWVEVWVADDKGHGEWKFLGACEPDPELNMGWFSVPSTRCLMVHSKAFGRYQGDEEVVKKSSLYSELNLLSHYAPTKKVTVTVLNADESPCTDATVKFKMYNYAEYYTLASYKVDSKAQASLTTGLGDLLVWVTDGTHYGYAKVDVRQEDNVTVYLTREAGTDYTDCLDIVPPVAGEAPVIPSEEAAAANEVRKTREDSIRNAYTATFPTQDNYLDYVDKRDCGAGNFTDAQLWELIQKSEGNYAEVIKFINHWYCRCRSFDHIYDYLKSYSDKDLRDISADVLEAQLTCFDFGSTHSLRSNRDNLPSIELSYEVYKQGIMPARISNELVRPWRQPLADALVDITDVEALKDWTVKNISVDDTGNYYNCPISPMGVYRLRHADAHSRDIFFVAACRALLIPAYLDNATNTIFVYRDNAWTKLAFEDSNPVQPTAKLTLTYKGSDPKMPVYYPHFTLQKFENGDFVTFDFEDDPRMASFPASIALEPGYYCLSTGRRLEDCSVLSRMEFFQVPENGQLSREIVLLSRSAEQQVYGKLDPAMPFAISTLADYAGNTGMLFCFMGDFKEPSKHLLKELQALQSEWKAWGGMTYMEAPASAKAASWNLANTDCAVSTPGSPMEQMVEKALGIDLKGNYPLVALVNKKGEIIFHNEGYRIGLAELILKKASM